MRKKRPVFCKGCDGDGWEHDTNYCLACRRMVATCENCEHLSLDRKRCDLLNRPKPERIENCNFFRNRRLT